MPLRGAPYLSGQIAAALAPATFPFFFWFFCRKSVACVRTTSTHLIMRSTTAWETSGEAVSPHTKSKKTGGDRRLRMEGFVGASTSSGGSSPAFRSTVAMTECGTENILQVYNEQLSNVPPPSMRAC